MSQFGYNSTRQSRIPLASPTRPSEISKVSPRHAIPAPILRGATLVDLGSSTPEASGSAPPDTRTSSSTSPQERTATWLNDSVLGDSSIQIQPFETLAGTCKVPLDPRTLFGHHLEQAHTTFLPRIPLPQGPEAGKLLGNQASDGFQGRQTSMKFPAMDLDLVPMSRLGEISPSEPVVVNRAIPDERNPFRRSADLDLKLLSGQHLNHGTDSKPDGESGEADFRNRTPLRKSNILNQSQRMSLIEDEVHAPPYDQHDLFAPTTPITPPGTALTAWLEIPEDTADAAERQDSRQPDGQYIGSLSQEDTTSSEPKLQPRTKLGNGSLIPLGYQCTVQPPTRTPYLRPLLQSSLQLPREKPFALHQTLRPSSLMQSTTPTQSLLQEIEMLHESHPPSDSSAGSARFLMTPRGTNITPDMHEKLYGVDGQAQNVMDLGTPYTDISEGEGSPRSPKSETYSSQEENDTPMTSPCPSPVKARPLARRLPRLDLALTQIDGAADDGDGVEAMREADAAAPGANHEAGVAATGSSVVSGQGNGARQPLSDGELDDLTPLAPASPAKGPHAFPFPAHSGNERSIPKLSTSRRPSALLQHCERNATPRQKRLMTAGLQAPDRFIASRAGTPTKGALLLARPRSKMSASDMGILNADPFGPVPARSLRMAERFATTRSPQPIPRSVGMIGSRVEDAQHPSTRAASAGTVWTVGGTIVTEGVASVTNGRGGRVTSGTSASHYSADFLRKNSPSEEELTHGRRLALAMEIDQGARMLDHSSPSSSRSPTNPRSGDSMGSRVWKDGTWDQEGSTTPCKAKKKKDKDIPIIPFRVLDAPALRDDYYCSLLAYSATIQCLAVGLGPHVYLWSEDRGARNIPDSLTAPYGSAHVTSLSFSSRDGACAILAIGRADGRITLWSPLDRDPRFDSEQPAPVSCVCFRPTTVKRSSLREPTATVPTEELLVGDELGHVYYYSIEWPGQEERDLFDWHGSMTLLARITCHSQQVCGIAWGPDGECFATGGNDNQLFLFESKKLLQRPANCRTNTRAAVHVRDGSSGSGSTTLTGQGEVLAILPGQEKHVFALNAAVKAIAFAPWQSTLLAAGGGSNDRCIHFFHTLSGANLATIDCHAQVTSLVWSEKRKEIASTFGFAQPEHPYRVAVFTWPSCQMVVRIPWWGEERALFAVAYPRGPRAGQPQESSQGSSSNNRSVGERRLDAEGRPWYGKRTKEEGCLVVATSDASIKFHEIWAEARSSGGKRVSSGVLGGSQILEEECSGDIERWAVIR